MQLAQYFMIFSVTTLAVSLTSYPGIAFTIKGQDIGRLPQNYQALSLFPNGSAGLTTLNAFDYLSPSSWLAPPGRVSEIARGGTSGLSRDLKPFRNTGWTFQTGGNLSGSFNIKNYYACGVGISYSCGAGVGVPIYIPERAVGATIKIDYEPKKSDPIPQPQINNLYWIQRVITNYESFGGSVGRRRSFIDNQGTLSDPFYNHSPLTSSDSYFIDNPHRTFEFNKSYYWFAELYLAEKIANTKTVKIYNGVRWGWRYNYLPLGKPIPVPIPKPVPIPIPKPLPVVLCPSGFSPKSGSVVIANSSSGGGGIGCVAISPTPRPSPSPTPRPTPSPSPAPRPTPSPAPRPTPSPTPRPTQSPTPSPIVIVSVSPAPSPSPWTPSPWPTPTPWVTSPLGSTSSTVVVSTSTTITSSSPLPKPSSPASSPIGRPIQAVPISAISKGNATNLRSSSLLDSSSKANTDYLTAIASDLLEDPELSSTDNSLNNANLASISSDLLEDSELSSTHSNENQVNLADISSDLLEDPELSSIENDENNADLVGISADLLEDPELSSEDNNYNEVDLAGISADLLEDPELSYVDDTLIAKTQNVSSKNTDDDALSAEAVPEPTTGLGTLFALAILPVIKRLKNRKNKE